MVQFESDEYYLLLNGKILLLNPVTVNSSHLARHGESHTRFAQALQLFVMSRPP